MTVALATGAATPSPSIVSRMRRCFATPLNTVLTLVTVGIVILIARPVLQWAFVDATWRGTAANCRATANGACWAFIAHKLPFIVFGLYPTDERWRPAVATGLLVLLVVLTATPRLWRRSLAIAWGVGFAAAFWLMHGGAGLDEIPTTRWGGLPLTIMLTTVGLTFGFPLGISLALARRSHFVVLRTIATLVIEVVRGIPLIAVLYLAVLVFPLALPEGIEASKLLLAQAAIALFASVYLAEAVRSGLQIVPKGRMDAALALGMTWWQAMRLATLPEALRIVVPSFISIAVGFFQDTSLVVIIGLFDLLNTARVAAQDPAWLGFYTEAYVFVGIVYFCGSAAISRYGLWLERRLKPA